MIVAFLSGWAFAHSFHSPTFPNTKRERTSQTAGYTPGTTHHDPIGIEHDVVAIPQPIAHVIVIVRRYLEEVPTDVEPIAPAAAQPPDA
jgi:hypothetical protein